MTALPTITPAMGFDEASAAVVAFLRTHVPLGLWSVSRYDGASQVHLEVADTAYGMHAGDAVPWEDTVCVRMVAGEGPQVAPDVAAVPAYASAPLAQAVPIGAYVGLPIRWADGRLFGTLCGADPVAQSEALTEQAPLLGLLAGLLSSILEADHARTQTARALERAELLADTDPLTGLYNRRGWLRFLELEEERYRRFGDPGSVVVLDLDALKEVNDTAGHAAGDAYIRAAGRALLASVRATDLVARLGGDEFGVIAGGTTPEQTALLVARISAALDAAGVAGSLGAAPYTIVSGFPGAWDKADRAMYDEKARRRAERARAGVRAAS